MEMRRLPGSGRMAQGKPSVNPFGGDRPPAPIVPPEGPNMTWLNKLIGPVYAAQYEYVGQVSVNGVTVHVHKNRKTKRPLNVSPDTRCWKWDRTKGTYSVIAREAAISQSLGI